MARLPLKKYVVRALVGLMVLGAIAALAGYLWLRVPVIASDFASAEARFTQVLGGEAELEPEALSMLAGAREAEPENARAELWFGLANMHSYLQRRELPYAIRAARALERAAELDTSNTSAEGWRAFFSYQAARSREEDLDAPRDALLAASAADPRFTPFLAAVSLAPMPLSSGYPERVLTPLVAIEDCGDGTSHTCRTNALNPHGAEGYHATVGDLHLRLGDVEAAKRSYARALSMESAATWPYREAFESWAQDAESRAAALANEEEWIEDASSIFFASGERACACCHER